MIQFGLASVLPYRVQEETEMCNMKKRDPKKDRWLHVRLSEIDYEILYKHFQQSTRKKISDYIRDLIVQRKVTIKSRNASLDDFMDEMILLRTELNALGNNFNQIVKKVNSATETKERVTWYSVATSLQKELLEKVNSIKVKLDNFSDLWLHGS